ncbi:MAG: hypothetical protein LBD03_09505 [Methanobrevibacter sp.]|jgi:hypothetical protein|nr:hypothetical protein [Candidatus Methanovirga procula]
MAFFSKTSNDNLKVLNSWAGASSSSGAADDIISKYNPFSIVLKHGDYMDFINRAQIIRKELVNETGVPDYIAERISINLRKFSMIHYNFIIL